MTGVDPSVMTPEAGYGFAQRKAWVFSAWWYPGVLALSGAVYGVFALLLGQSPETGVVMAILGTALSALGWALTIAPRFTRKRPRPASDIPRVEQGIRTTPITIRTLLIAGALAVAALMLFTPGGASVDVLPLFGLLVTLILGMCAGLAHIRRLMMNSAELYATWLKRR